MSHMRETDCLVNSYLPKYRFQMFKCISDLIENCNVTDSFFLSLFNCTSSPLVRFGEGGVSLKSH